MFINSFNDSREPLSELKKFREFNSSWERSRDLASYLCTSSYLPLFLLSDLFRGLRLNRKPFTRREKVPKLGYFLLSYDFFIRRDLPNRHSHLVDKSTISYT